MKTTTRSYTMRTRAEQVQATRDRILDATIALGGERPLGACTLPAVADRAGVSVQTVLRAFRSRDGLLEAAIQHSLTAVRAERPADPRNLRGSIEALVDHYELRGDGTLLLLGQESWEPFAARATSVGKRFHRDWVEAVFADAIDASDRASRVELVDLLVAATDVSTWKLWRRDAGRSRNETVDRMLRLATSVTEHL
ncbi:TetR/AcrR family transcriptional regulator [Agromyces bauzanensis]